MQSIISLLFRAAKKILFVLYTVVICKFYTRFLMYVYKIQIGKGFSTTGTPYLSIAANSKVSIGTNFRLHNNLAGNPIGRWQKSILVVGDGGILIIGNNVGMSFTAINCKKSIKIGNDVMIGGGTCIYDSDFHPLGHAERQNKMDELTAKAAVIIEDNVFIGAHSTVLKGVTIGKNSIIGACSVVVKSVPPNQIWGGNPAKFLKSLDQSLS